MKHRLSPINLQTMSDNPVDCLPKPSIAAVTDRLQEIGGCT
jgi:hypothetical protein